MLFMITLSRKLFVTFLSVPELYDDNYSVLHTIVT